MEFLQRLGDKGKAIYQLGKKGLDTVVSLGQKAKQFVHSSPVQTAIGWLPPQLQAGVRGGIMLGEQLLSAGERLQSKLNTGEALGREVKSEYDRTFKKPTSIELPKQSERRKDIEQIAEASRYDPRIPVLRMNKPIK